MMTMESTVIWDVMPHGLVEVHQHSSETSVNYLTAWHHIPEDSQEQEINVLNNPN
jgi:hypothetical protein